MMTHVANILDEIHTGLDPRVWNDPESDEPTLKPQHADFIKHAIYSALEQNGYARPKTWLHLVLTGSTTTYQFSDDSDVDVSLFIDSEIFPEWSRAEMIAIMIDHVDGKKLPGTPFPLQDYVVPAHIKPADLYRKGLRSGWDIDQQRWIVPPERDRVHDVQAQENGFYVWALQAADKMERLLRYEPEKAKTYWHQLHERRRNDMAKGKGDFAESNVVYKFLANRNLFPAISEATGEYLAKTSATADEHQGVLDANAGQNLQGLPGPVNVGGYGRLQFNAHGDMQRIANEYNGVNGLPSHPTDYVKVNQANAQSIAQEYENMPHNPHDPEVAGAYGALSQELRAQYDHAVSNGYQFEFYPQDRDPYPSSPREAVLDLHHNKHMYVYPTAAGFGSGDDEQYPDHPLMGETGLQWNGKPVYHNDLFRAIHDFYGHAKEGLGFRADGEDNAFRQHQAMFSPPAQRALTSETRGQNSWVNYGPYGEHNQTATSDTVFAPQKAGLMPEWTSDPNLHLNGATTSGAVYEGIVRDGGRVPPTHDYDEPCEVWGNLTSINRGASLTSVSYQDDYQKEMKRRWSSLPLYLESLEEAVKQAAGEQPVEPEFQEIPGATFHQHFQQALAHPKFGKYLTPHSPEEFAQMRTFIHPSGLVGGALQYHPDGRIEAGSLFNAGGPRGAGMKMMQHLIGQGANYLSAIGDPLRQKYEGQGFQIANTLPWDDQYAPENWDYESQGRPNVYEMSLGSQPSGQSFT
jgi:hypothetical protein